MIPGILDYFPLQKIRPVQERALVEVFNAFESGKRFVILEAPTGTGKSPLAIALGNYYRSAYILTKTIQLQDQYIQAFKDVRELKGRSNFDCYRMEGSCEAGASAFKKSPCDKTQCPYRQAKAEAVRAELTVCNYMSYLYNIGTTPWAHAALQPLDRDDDLGVYDAHWTRPLLICDEAHGVEGMLMEHVSVTVDLMKVPFKFIWPTPKPDDAKACFDWLSAFVSALESASEEVQDLTPLRRLRRKACFALEHREAEEWISEPLESEMGTGFVIKPLTVRSFAERLFKHGERVLLMSATILDPEKMAQSLGINDYSYVCVPCPFSVDSRPVISAGLNMTMAHRARSWPAMVDQIRIILDAHSDEKGLILCPSNEMVDYIIEGVTPPQKTRLISARGDGRLIDYQRHLNATGPTVLIAAGFWEGADLKDDFSRFQILPALPRPYWGGQTAARAKLDPAWYRLQTFAQLLQGAGRSVRSETDEACTYVLDRALRDEAERSDTLLPVWFREALIYA